MRSHAETSERFEGFAQRAAYVVMAALLAGCSGGGAPEAALVRAPVVLAPSGADAASAGATVVVMAPE